jgi:hypothetical protein
MERLCQRFLRHELAPPMLELRIPPKPPVKIGLTRGMVSRTRKGGRPTAALRLLSFAITSTYCFPVFASASFRLSCLVIFSIVLTPVAQSFYHCSGGVGAAAQGTSDRDQDALTVIQARGFQARGGCRIARLSAGVQFVG